MTQPRKLENQYPMKASASLRFPLLLSSGLLLGSFALPAAAANEPRGGSASSPSSNQTSVAQLNEEGAAFYAARDYRHAIEKFIQAYAIDSDPNLLFNIARCYEELGENQAAIEKYEAFLKTPGADAKGRQRARESLTALREAEAAGSSGFGAGPAVPADGGKREGAGEPVADMGSSGPSPWRWVALGGSVLSAAVGTTLYVMGANDHGEVTDARGYGDDTQVASLTRKQAQELVDSGDSKKLIGGISLGVAGALAVTYVVMLVTQEEPNPSEGPSLALDWSPSGSSLTWQGSF